MANTNIKVIKKERDSSLVLLHKFQKKVQESGVLPKVRSKRYNKRDESKAKIKKGKMKKLNGAAKYDELKRAGKLKNLKALLVGSFIQMKDHQIPFGYNVKEMVLQHSEGYNYPIVFDVDAGHHLHNLTIPFGINAKYYNGFLTFANS